MSPPLNDQTGGTGGGDPSSTENSVSNFASKEDTKAIKDMVQFNMNIAWAVIAVLAVITVTGFVLVAFDVARDNNLRDKFDKLNDEFISIKESFINFRNYVDTIDKN